MKLACDRCGKTLLLDEDVHYKVRIQVYAAYDPMELTEDDLAKDHRAEMLRLLRQLEKQDPESVQDSVYREMDFDICPVCRREFIADPLGCAQGGPPPDK